MASSVNTATPSAEPEKAEPVKLVAPLWHTVLVVLLLLAIALRSFYAGGLLGGTNSTRITRYLITMAMEWALVGVVFWGIRLNGTTMRQLIGGDWSQAKWFFRDLGIAIVFLIASILLLSVVSSAMHLGPPDNVRGFLPHTGMEKSLWILLSLTAGICEEIVTRGYLQRQFTALTRSAPTAIVIQGAIFGVAHIYQGWGHVFVIFLLGCMLGGLAQWRKTLRPGIVSHFLQDATAIFQHGM